MLSLTINQMLEHLEQSFDSQKSFVANASHELRTPITSILGEAEITLMKERDPETYKSALKEIVSSVERLNLIINSLMELMQTNLDNRDFQNVKVDELMWEIADELAGKSNGDQVRMGYHLPEDITKSVISGNRRLLFIAISNILKNAVKFSEGKTVDCEVRYIDKGIQITIRDQGIGIAKDDLIKIFQPFFRASNAMNFQGYGIGLSLTDNIVKLHNGTISINSVLEQGTTIVVFFPTA
ncbi:sensor histidine kinase [Pedobacter antarcticus]|nr:HAMP domain-containing sensor histidine kinase [Pedobacter antarcticus]